MILKRRCGRAAFAVSLNLVALAHTQGATINSASPSLTDVSAAITLASEGDTVVIPAGTVKWTATLKITKGITLVGATTISGDHDTTLSGTPMSANDQTIIGNNVPLVNGNNPVINVSLAAAQSFRMTGITFQQGTTGTGGNGQIIVSGSQNIRIDHCHISLGGQNVHFYDCFGVLDHCIFDCTGSSLVAMVGNGTYGGGVWGDGSWADGPNFGTNKFVFFEDNTFNNNNGAQTAANIDGTPGGRYVMRYNVLKGSLMGGGHGTENGERGIRSAEYYGNVLYPNSNCCGGNWGGIQRSGTLLSYNNTWVTTNSDFVGGKALQVFRDFWYYPPWGAADGANPWDVNDTEGNGTYVPGHSPHLFESGTHTGASGATTLTDSTNNWTANRWLNFSLTNVAINRPGAITGNTNNAINYVLYDDQGAPLKFNNGDTYQIHKLLVPMDGVGRGKGDLVKRVNGQPQNSTTGRASWPHNALEPCYSWDSYKGQPVKLHSGSGQVGSIVENRDYYNLNTTWTPGNPLRAGVAVGTLANRPTQCTAGTDIVTGAAAPGVGYWATDTNTFYVCTASDTWTSYYSPFAYPHPLAGGANPSPTPPSPPQNLRVTGP